MKISCTRPAALLAPFLIVLSTTTSIAQTTVTLPAPIAGTFEDFNSLEEGGDLSVKGWTVTNFTSEITLDPNLDDPDSSSYEDWVVISRERMTAIGGAGGWDAGRRLQVAPDQIVNGVPVTELMQDKFIWAESDARSGSQIQYLESPNFNCTGQVGVTLVFYSAYEQNQDNLGAVEYSVDGGASWLPVAYLIDAQDIIRDGEGNVDAEATLTTSYGDVASYTDELGEFIGGTYGSFIKAPISAELAPFIQGRINDNSVESKRVEVYRLAQADNKAEVRLRFAHAGTESWYWGLDNIGLYAIPPKSPPSRPTVTAPATAPFFSPSVTLTGSAFAGSDPGQLHGLSVWQVAADTSAFSADTGLAAPFIVMASSTSLTTLPLSLDRLFPGQTVQISLQHQDQFSNKSQFADPVSMTVSSAFPPAVPGTFEDFEDEVEFESPVGWTAENQSDEGLSYPGWFVASTDTLSGFGGGRLAVPDIVSGLSLYGESDTQSGNQVMYITTPEYNLSAHGGVWIAFKSNYEQNQDSFGGLEYSTDGGATWKPIVYMMDLPDIVRLPSGEVDATTTLTTPHGDLAKVIGDDGLRVENGRFADFILARPLDALGPFISGRLNDDPVESKRYERYRIAGADNQARVQFRFAHTGTGSWYWGIDDFGLYSEASAPPQPESRITSVRRFVPVAGALASVELKWASVAGKKYTVQTATTLAAWVPLQTNLDATGTETTYTHVDIPAADIVRYYRVLTQP